jgi:hypothetical protein
MEEITNKYLIYENKVEKGCKLNHCHKPDPICKNNGKCSPQKKEGNVICDCRWTGFTGKTCTESKLCDILNIGIRTDMDFNSEAQLMGEVGWTSNLIQSVNFMSFIWNDNMREKREANANAT